MNEEDVGVITVLTFAMSLQLVVIKATNLPNKEKFGESDPYISIEFQGKMLYIPYLVLSEPCILYIMDSDKKHAISYLQA